MRAIKKVAGWAPGAFVWAWVVLSVIPFLFMVVTSIKPNGLTLTSPPVWDFAPSVDNYVRVLSGPNSMLPLIVNSSIVAGGATLLAIVVGLPAAYALTMPGFGPRNKLGAWIISTIIMPPVIAIIPIFVLAGSWNLMDTYPVLIISYAAFNLPMVVWILRSTLLQVPVEIEEAATVDGASRPRILVGILMPLVAPGIATAVIFSVVMCWNEFLFALALTRDVTQTAPLGVFSFQGQYATDWGGITAAGTVVVAPVLLFVLILRRKFVSGLSFGAVK
jgi:ABC-type glycerol-3-phosphate transport system permease component